MVRRFSSLILPVTLQYGVLPAMDVRLTVHRSLFCRYVVQETKAKKEKSTMQLKHRFPGLLVRALFVLVVVVL